MADKPYLFPAPGTVLRRGLNILAQLGETFTEDDATADLMLDIDNVARGRVRARGATGLPHAYSYYAKRWGWGKGTVTRAFAGDDERGVEPWIRERVALWRSFYGTAGDRGGTAGDQKPANTAPSGPIGDRSGTAGDRGGTGIGQTTDLQNQRERDGSASGAKPGGACWEHPAVVAYAESAGEPGEPWWMPEANANQVARRFGPDPKPDLIRTLSEFVAAYRASDWKVRNVPTVLRAFDEHLNRLATPDRPERPGRRRPNNPAGSDDLAASAARTAERAARALGLEPGGVE